MNVGELNSQGKVKSSSVKAGSPLRQRIIKAIIYVLAHVVLRLRFEGVENIPAQGGLMITTNHMSLADTAILLLNPVRKDQAALVTDKYKTSPIIRFLVTSMPHIWIDRTRADFSAFSAAIEYLQHGGTIGIAPEGTRSKTGQLIEGKPGAALISMRTGVPLLPVGIAGTEAFHHNVLRLKRTRVTVRFGKPYRLPPFDGQDRGEYMQRANDEVMCHIAAMLPRRYHGFYAGHPRLEELLSGQKEYES